MEYKNNQNHYWRFLNMKDIKFYATKNGLTLINFFKESCLFESLTSFKIKINNGLIQLKRLIDLCNLVLTKKSKTFFTKKYMMNYYILKY